MYRTSPGQPCSANAISTNTHNTTPAARPSTTRLRRTAAIATATSAASCTGSSLRPVKRPMVPNTLSLVSRRPEPSALLAATNGLRDVSAGIPNHSSTTTAQPPTSSHRASRTARQAQIEYRAKNGHTSGRPSAASAPSTNAAR